MSYLLPNYQRKEFEILAGKGRTLTDNHGREFLDFTSGIGVVNLGYDDPDLQAALIYQSGKLWHTPNLYQNHLQESVAELACTPYDYQAYFCSSGAEANEAAVKFARKATGRTDFISFNQSFHGRTFGAMSVTGQPSIHEGFEPLVPGFSYVVFNQKEGVETYLNEKTAGVFLELIQGEGGVIPAEPEWVKWLAERCRENGTLLIVDEVQTGIGRTGSLYAFEQYDIQPDVITLAKGLGNGIPVGAMLAKKEYQDAFSPGAHGSTFGGNKLAMVVAEQVLKKVKQADFLSAVKEKGNQMERGLKNLPQERIKKIRGKGLMWGIEFSETYPVAELMEKLEQNGLLTLKAGKNVLRLLPPLTITKEEIDKGLRILQQTISS